MKKHRNDIILAGVLILAGTIIILLFSLPSKNGKTVKVTYNGETEEFSLSENTEKALVTEKGENVFVIENGKAFMKSASCPDKICVNHKPVSKSGETVICLPNEVVIEIE